MPFIKTDFPGLLIFQPVVYEDARGYFFESYNQRLFADEGLHYHWIQDNQSCSHYGVIRGLHYQNPPKAQTKLVRTLEGRILDVAVDIRKGSPTFGQVFSIELTAENKLQVLIPAGFAHGFSVLSTHATILYKCDNLYSKEAEGSIAYNDPALQIDWKIPAEKIILSDKDRSHPSFKDCTNHFEFEG
ncbi:MAG: dTDP-4-dehydrorhamnose 3,5-epimerase [Chitinophagaceae bacterium]|nr:dTDP-4-dehydrorhamnose 3,5-epimerase [Chitinophagaceae bacterium]